MTPPRRRGMVIAVLLASGLHAALAIGLFWPAENTGAANVGFGGIEVAFGSAGGAPGKATLVRPDALSDDAQSDRLSDVQPVRTAQVEIPLAEKLDPPVIRQSESAVTAPIEPDTADMADPTVAPRTDVEQVDLMPPREAPVEEEVPIHDDTRTDVAEAQGPKSEITEVLPEAIDAGEPEPIDRDTTPITVSEPPPPADPARVAVAQPAELVVAKAQMTLPELEPVEAQELLPDLEAVKGPPPEDFLETVSISDVEQVGLTLAEDVKLTAGPPPEIVRVAPTKIDVNQQPLAIKRAEPAKVEDTRPTGPILERVRSVETVSRSIDVPETVRRPRTKPATPVRAPEPTIVDAPVIETNPMQTLRAAEPVQTVAEVSPRTAAPQTQSIGDTVVAALPANGVAQAAAVPPGTGRSGDTGEGPKTGDADQRASGGNPGARADYLTQLMAILTQHKRYPRWAQSRQQEGIGELYFVVAESGDVLSLRLHKSSGHRLLDKEILSILERVGKLPPIPSSIGTNQLEIVVPIVFNLQ